jgi:hypothetical protein
MRPDYSALYLAMWYVGLQGSTVGGTTTIQYWIVPPWGMTWGFEK